MTFSSINNVVKYLLLQMWFRHPVSTKTGATYQGGKTNYFWMLTVQSEIELILCLSMWQIRRQQLQNTKGELGADTMWKCEMFLFGVTVLLLRFWETVKTSELLNHKSVCFLCVLTDAFQSVTRVIIFFKNLNVCSSFHSTSAWTVKFSAVATSAISCPATVCKIPPDASPDNCLLSWCCWSVCSLSCLFPSLSLVGLVGVCQGQPTSNHIRVT